MALGYVLSPQGLALSALWANNGDSKSMLLPGVVVHFRHSSAREAEAGGLPSSQG